MLPGYNTGGSEDVKSAAHVLAQGMSGFIVSDEGGVSIAHVQPHHDDKVKIA